METIKLSKLFACHAHRSIGQTRKGSGEPYEVHPIAVEQILRKVTDDKELLAAAPLHDIEEDVAPFRKVISEGEMRLFGLDPSRVWYFDIEAIRELFGPRTASLVLEVTDVYTAKAYPMYNRKRRQGFEAERIAGISPDGKLLKLADILHNTKDVHTLGGFAATWLSEVVEKLPLLKVEGDGRNAFLYGACETSLLLNMELLS